MYRFWVDDPMMHCLLVQEVKEVFDCQGDGPARAEDHLKQVVNKLLQCTLKRKERGG